MNDDAKTGLQALLLLVTLVAGISLGAWLGDAWYGLLVVSGVWIGVAAHALLRALSAGERKPRISRQQHRANIATLAARVVMDVEEAV